MLHQDIPIERYVQLKPLAKFKAQCSMNDQHVAWSHLNSFYKYQAFRTQSLVSLPIGWHHHADPEYNYYTHTSHSSNEDIRYAYPLPHASKSPKAANIVSPFLLCNTPIAKLQVGQVLNSNVNDNLQPRYAHLLHFDNIVGLVLFPEINEASIQGLHSCELAALSEADVPDNFDFRRFPSLHGREVAWSIKNECLELIARPSFYNLLWTEWEHDVAHRKGIGIVQKQAWDLLSVETKTFQLG
jgi:hypothetical protein